MLKTFEFKIKKNKTGFFATSLVDEPAILVDFLKLAKYKEPELHLAINKKQKIITGPLMIPNLRILRSAKFLNEKEDGYMFFSEKTCYELFMKNMIEEKMNNITLGHDTKSNDLKLVEAWVILNPKNDKANELRFELCKGSIMSSYKVLNNILWEDILLGKYNGFSIEAIGFDKVEKPLDMEKELTVDEAAEIIVNTLNK